MTTRSEALFEFMPYGAPELKEVARTYMFRGVLVGSGAWLLLYLVSFGTSELLKRQPHETSVIVVPYRELAAPPPLSQDTPPPQVSITQPAAPPTVAIPVPVPDAEAPPEQTIASQEEIAAIMPGVSSGDGDNIVVAPPSDDQLPQFGEYVYVEELPEAVTKVPPAYPDMAREANVDGTVLVQALVGKNGKVIDVKVVKSIPMLDQAAAEAVRKWIFKPALSNNKPVAVWVAVPVKFSLH
ncbi:MAG: energy transducer TonB [Candidatus Eisenbacteria bacterium]|uniref:Energy transducer TonB n=1 Tax=Eiseniibacteriota bacterium TaxID=2212470 RepID=A0A849SQU7_UNCEI|nr:energy transducer TonB [Candidatus Eisenbacteria bacterium]